MIFCAEGFSADTSIRTWPELGFIVVQIDGMGPPTAKVFHDMANRDLGMAASRPHAWMRAAAERYPYMDISRVGIYGSSAGGCTPASPLAFGDFYDVGVAMSANHDHRTYSVVERALDGLPSGAALRGAVEYHPGGQPHGRLSRSMARWT